MKLLIALTLLLNTLLFAQFDKLERLKQLQQEGLINYIYLGNDIYKLTYPNGETKQLYIGKPKTQTTLDSIPTTTIDTWNVDTMLYHNMYSYWKELPTITLPGYQLIIGDANNNGLPEVYAPTKNYDDPSDFQNMEVFEVDSSGQYTSKFVYADSIGVLWGLYDINRDGNLELLTRRLSYSKDNIFFKRDSVNNFPTKLNFVFADYLQQKDDPTFGDFDKNGKIDMIFCLSNPSIPIIICEYDSSINNFHTTFIYIDSVGSYHRGFAVGDFDEDGKTDIVFGGLYGEINVIENDGEHNYKIAYSSNTGGVNSFMTFATHDLNGNGKPEFWVSSTTYIGSRDVLRFSCYEAVDDNNYKEINRLDFLDIFPIYAFNSLANDIDRDGIDEIVICFDAHVFIIKPDPKAVYPAYKILYMSRNNTSGSYWGATMFDFNNDDFAELLIHRSKYRQDGKFKLCTDVFYPDYLVSTELENDNLALDYTLQQNYPNPFNPYTSVVYNLPKSTKVTIKVYDILGNEIITLINEEKQPGNHIIQWNGKDKFNNTVSSGIYFINLKTPDFNKTIKGVMLK